MGFLDKLKEVGQGVTDLVTAPIGMLWDTARAIGSAEYNPGFFGVFGERSIQAVEGLTKIGSGTGINRGLESLGESQVGGHLKSFWDEVELLYSTEFQRQEQRVPEFYQDVAGMFGKQLTPGDFSVQRGLAAGIGLAGAGLNDPMMQQGEAQQIWRRAAKQTPGQAFYEEILAPGFHTRTPADQEMVIASAGYQMVTGTIDAVSRWFLSPDVLLGKGIKNVRNTAFIFDAERHLRQAARKLTPEGLRVTQSRELLDGFRAITLGETKKNQRVWAVPRTSGMEQLVDEGRVNLKQGMDPMIDGTDSIKAADDLGKRAKAEVDPEALAEEVRALEVDVPSGDPVADAIEFYATRGIDSADPVSAVDQLLQGTEFGDTASMQGLLDALERGGASDNLVSAVASQFQKMAKSRAIGNASDEVARVADMPGSLKTRPKTMPRYAGQSNRPIVLFTKREDAVRYAATLYRQDPSDMPLLLNVKANKLDAIYEEFDSPLAEPGGDAAFFTTAEKLEAQDMHIERMYGDEFDAEFLGTQDTRRNWRLYEQDGRAVEPDQVIPFDNMRLDFETAMGMDGVMGRKYLADRNAANAVRGGATNLYDVAAKSRVVTQVLNHMDGKGADEIRRTFFNNHPFGQRIATDLASVKTFDERRTVLLGYMGYRLPEIDALPELLRGKIKILQREMDNVEAGFSPNDRYMAMIDQPGRFTDPPPDQWGTVAKEMLEELENQEAFATFLRDAVNYAPIRQVSMPYPRLAANMLRKQSWYQERFYMAPVRVVTEMKPHRFLNVRDGMSDRQLDRQLAEAQSMGITKAERETAVQKYMAAPNERAKVDAVAEAEDMIIKAAARKAKMSEDEFLKALDEARKGRHSVQAYLASRRYAAGGRDRIEFPDKDTGEIVTRIMPLLDTQVEAWIPLTDVAALKKVATRIGTFRARYGSAADNTEIFLDTFYQLWKPTVLLRGGWMIRVVSDEQLRILAKMGSLLRHLAAIEAGEKPKFSGILEKDLTFGQRAGAGLATATLTQPLTAVGSRVAGGISYGARKLGLTSPRYWEHVKGTDVEPMVSARAGYGGPNESLASDMRTLMGREEETFLNHLRDKASGQWRSIVRGEREFGPAWSRALARQFGNSPVGRNITASILELTRGQRLSRTTGRLTDEDYAEVVKRFKVFLRETDDGRGIAEAMEYRSRDPERWADDIIETLKDYTAGFDEALLDGVMRKKVTTQMMENIDEALRPDVVHGEIIDQALARSDIGVFVQDFISQSYDLLGRLPTDTLSRQPFFKQVFALEMMRLEDLHAAQGLDLTEGVIQQMKKSAHAFAVRESQTYLYDLAEVSRLGDMMRFFTPFYAAWQEVISVWTGLIVQDPSIIARGRMLWTAPNRADMVYTDDEGNEFIQFRLSEKAADGLDLQGWQRYLATGGVRVGKSSFNLVLNNPLPGAGPLIQYPINEVVKKKPELEAGVKWLLPFGVAVDSKQIFLSPLIRQLAGEMQGPESDRSYVRAWQDAISWMDVQHRLGLRAAPTEEEAHDVASKLWTFRLLTRLWSPVQPIFDSPLQPYMDTYRDMIDNLGPEQADEAFLNEYGNEFFAVTLSRTVSKTGLPPTVEAEVARRNFEGLIEQYPEYGRMIVGDQALGEFSTAAYAAQLERPIDPGNPMSEMERVYRPTELDPRTGKIMEIDRRLGWQEYIRLMDGIDLIRRQQGLPNLRVKEAQQLAAFRDAKVQELAAQYGSWWDDFNTRDELKWSKRLEAFRAIAKAEPLSSRADIQGLQDYLVQRSIVVQELNRRKQLGGAATLEAVANQDLLEYWESQINTIIEDNVAFGPLYFRYLEGDTLSTRDNG